MLSRAGILRDSVLHRRARLSRACNGRPANLLKVQDYVHLGRFCKPLVGGSNPSVGTKKSKGYAVTINLNSEKLAPELRITRTFAGSLFPSCSHGSDGHSSAALEEMAVRVEGHPEQQIITHLAIS